MRALTCSHGRAPVCDLPPEPTPLRGPHSAWCVSARGQCYRSQGATCLRASEHSEIRTASAAMKVKVYFRELPVPESRVASTHRPGCRVSPGDSLYRKKTTGHGNQGAGGQGGGRGAVVVGRPVWFGSQHSIIPSGPTALGAFCLHRPGALR